MIRIMTDVRPKFITITVDGELSSEYVSTVETCVSQAIAQERPVRLFLRDVSRIDESGRALLGAMAAKGVRLRASGVYSSYVVARISQSAA
jgi:ABC-type transporter Mla MlaB component